MGEVKQINIKNQTYYFYQEQINLKDFDARLLKFDKKECKEINVYYTGYVTVKTVDNCHNINSVNPLQLMINEMIGHLETSIQFWMMWMKIKKFQKNMKKFGKVLKKKLKRLMVVKKLNMGKIF